MGVALTLDFLERTALKRPYLWECTDTTSTFAHNWTSTASAAAEAVAKHEMCTFDNQSGVRATSLPLGGVCWHRAFCSTSDFRASNPPREYRYQMCCS